jgi:hypothetical protein
MGSSSAVTPDELRRFLLGQLAEGPAEAIEARLLAEPDLLPGLETAEDDLIEDYLAEGLSPEDRASFEQHFLASKRRRESLACARMVRAHYLAAAEPAAETPSRTTPSPFLRPVKARPVSAVATRWLAAAAAVVLTVWAGVTALRREPTRIADILAPSPAGPAVRRPSPAVLAPSPGPSTPTRSMAPSGDARPVRVASLTLMAAQTMEGEAERSVLTLHPDDEQVLLQIVLEAPEAYGEMRTAVLSADGRTVQEKRFVKPASILELRFPARGMAPGTYTVRLTGQAKAGGPPEDVALAFSVRRPR